MRDFTNNLVLFILNDPLDHWCDQAAQTIQLVTKKNVVVVFCLGNYITWKDLFFSHSRCSLVEHRWSALLYHPFFIFPGQRFSIIKKINFIINAWFVKIYLNYCYKKQKKFFWFFDPNYVPPLIKMFSQYITLYDCVDYYSDVSKELGKANRFLFSYATHVFADSHALAKKMQKHRKTVTVVPLGFAEEIFFQEGVIKKRKRQKTVGFVGGITPRLNFTLLTTVAKRLPDVEFVFYGKIVSELQTREGKLCASVSRLFSLPNVSLKGYAPKKEMPKVIQSFDVAIIPYTEDSFNMYCFPMKLMEYFYMGKPVLSTPIKELERFPQYVFIANTPAKWEVSIQKLLSTSWPIAKQKVQKRIAMSHTWEKKITKITSVI